MLLNNQNMNSFPTDIYSLNKLGGLNFLEKNKSWPVNDFKFDEIINRFHKDFFLNAEKLNRTTKEILYVDFAFLYFSSYVIHFKVLKEILKKKKIKIEIGNNSKNFIDLDYIKLSNPFNDNKSESNIKLIIKFFLKNIKKFVFFFFNKKKFLSIGGSSLLKKNYVKKNKIISVETYPQLIINPTLNFDKSSNYKKILNPIFATLEKNLNKQFRIKINLDDLIKIWSNRYSVIEITLKNLIKKNTNFCGILVESNQKVSSRFLSLYFMLKKKEAISFDHGNHANGRNKHKLLSAQLLSYNKFITISKNSKKSLLKILNSSITKKSTAHMNIEFIKNEYLKKIFTINKKQPIKKVSKNIMLMGWPMNSRKYFDEGPCSFFYNKILLEIELIKFLKDNNYKIFYKAHPERPDFINQIYSKYVDKIFFEKLESLKDFKKIDTLIFTNTCSSTFGYSLCTNKKILLLFNEKYFPEHLKDLKKRVSIIYSNFNQKKNYKL